MSGRHSRDRGATLVEAAFAIPIFFMLVFGLIDFGLLGFNNSQASNAARDGARVGIINFVDRTNPAVPVGAEENKTNASFRAIKAAIDKNLPGQDLADDDVSVECVDPNDTPTPCKAARVDIDRIRVEVEWKHQHVSPVAALLGFTSTTVDGEATMVLVGAPTVGLPSSPSCDVTAVSASPNPVALEDPAPSALSSDVTATVTSAGSCNLEVKLDPPGPEAAFTICTGTCASTTYFAGTDSFWEVGTAEVQVTGGSVIRFATFEVVAPPPCIVSLSDVSPDPVERWTSGPNADQLTQNLSIPISAHGDCDNLIVTMVGTGGSRQICGPSPACATALTYGASADSFWTTPGTGRVIVDGAANTPISDTFTVTNSATCAVAGMTTDPSTVRRDKNDQLPAQGGGYRLRITLATSGPCGSLSVSLTPPGSAAPLPMTRVGETGWLFTYNGSQKVWPTGQATATVSGDAATTFAFQVNDPPA